MEDGWKDSYSIWWSWSGVVSRREYRVKHFLHLVAGYHSSIRVCLETFEAKTVQYKALSIVASHECKSSMILWPRDPHYNRPSEPRQHHPSQGHGSHPSRCAIGAVTLATALLRDRRGAKKGVWKRSGNSEFYACFEVFFSVSCTPVRKEGFKVCRRFKKNLRLFVNQPKFKMFRRVSRVRTSHQWKKTPVALLLSYDQSGSGHG